MNLCQSAVVVSFRRKNQNSFAGAQIHANLARRGQVFGKLQTAFAFLRVHKIPIPIGLMPIFAIVQRDDSRNAGVRTPHQPSVVYLRLKLKGGVLMVHRVIVASGKKWCDGQDSFCRRFQQAPRQRNERCAVKSDDLLLDLGAVFESEYPLWPRLAFEFDNSLGAVGMHDLRRVQLRRDSVVAIRRFN